VVDRDSARVWCLSGGDWGNGNHRTWHRTLDREHLVLRHRRGTRHGQGGELNWVVDDAREPVAERGQVGGVGLIGWVFWATLRAPPRRD
jgi:hypothetical protein